MSRIGIVGAGLAGSYLAVVLARNGIEVRLHERRPLAQLLTPVPQAGTRSIALALSHRGLHALRRIGLEEEALQRGRRMLGREVHLEDGETAFSAYDPTGRGTILAITRGELLQLLLEKAARTPGIELHCGSAVEEWRQTRHAVQLRSQDGAEASFDAVVAADGARSRTRAALQAAGAFFRQHDSGIGYKEVMLQPRGRPFNPRALHIWSRGSLMLVGLPSAREGCLDGTLFVPAERAGEWFSDPETLLRRWHTAFADVEMTGDAAAAFVQRPLGRIHSVEGGPWHHRRILLIGDAAHAMAPFLGQGMNCALEDCETLLHSLRRHPRDFEAAFADFERYRRDDVAAIAALSDSNFQEMHEHTRTPAYYRRKRIEARLVQRFGDRFVPVYSLITFGSLPYAAILRLKRLQDELLSQIEANGNGDDIDGSAVLPQLQRYHRAARPLLGT
jgi:kynurenine 3-monooxygenase